MERTRSLITPGRGKSQPSRGMLSTAISGSGRPGAVCAVEVPHHGRERRSHEALLGVGVVERAHLERQAAVLAEIHGLLACASLEVPEVDAVAVAAGFDVGGG